MKLRLLLALLALPALMVHLRAGDAYVDGEWTAAQAPSGSAQPFSVNAACVGPLSSPFDGWPALPRRECHDVLGPADITWEPARLNLRVDQKDQRVTGSLRFPSIRLLGGMGFPGSRNCGKVKVEEGRFNGNTLSFTTFFSVNGSRIPVRWSGEVASSGDLTLRSDSALSCHGLNGNLAGGFGGGGFGGGGFQAAGFGRARPASPPIDVMTRLQRGDKPKESDGTVEGKWWSLENGRLMAISLKVESRNRVKGSVIACGQELKIEEGLLAGQTITFKTFREAGGKRFPSAWNGELVDSQTLQLLTPGIMSCRDVAPVTIAFVRSK